MKVLSLLQPWASLVVMGVKQIETRSWNTRHRGPMLIHASTGKKGGALSELAPFRRYIKDFSLLPFGAIIGKVELVDTFQFGPEDLLDDRIARLTMEERAFGDYTPGRYGWVIEEPVMFSKPLPHRGSLMLWEFPDDLLPEEFFK